MVAEVAVASKKTANGATPLRRLGVTPGSEMAAVAPVVEQAEPDMVTVVLWLVIPPGPVHVTV